MIITNFATKEYFKAQERLVKSLNGHKTLFFTDYQPGWPTHQQSPYEFKLHAIEKAFQKDDIVLWVDSSMYLVGDISKIEKIISEDGYFFSEAGHYVGRWCNEHTRKYFGLTPEELRQGPGGITMFSAGLVGFSKRSLEATFFLNAWQAAADAGCFRGNVVDHRHDQTAGSIIATRTGMKYQRGGEHMSYIGPGYAAPEPGSVFHLQGL